MHPEARHFTEWVKSILPWAFKNRRCLDAGGGDINGNNKILFDWDTGTVVRYQCNDIGDAPNATVVGATKDLEFPDEHFDTIISTECFEHDAQYEDSLRKIVQMLKPGGVFLFTCASTGRAEHGTRRTSPWESWGTKDGNEHFQDYYKNLTIEDIKKAIPVDDIFEEWVSYYGGYNDLYFLGIKTGGTARTLCIPPYVGNPRGTCLTGGNMVFCLQNDQFELESRTTVHYGVGDRWNSLTLDAGTYIADDALFGDPYLGAYKMCRLERDIS